MYSHKTHIAIKMRQELQPHSGDATELMQARTHNSRVNKMTG